MSKSVSPANTIRYIIEQAPRPDLQRPWPIAVDDNMDVLSGLGPDDGARLVGFQKPGIQRIEVMARGGFEVLPQVAVGLEPVFSDGENLFVMQGQVVEVVVRDGEL